MSISVNLGELIEYTDWDRGKWYDLFHQQGNSVLTISVGPHGDGRFQTAGDVVRHIFSAEKRYVERLSNRPLTDTSSVSNSNVDALFLFGRQSREDLKEFVKTFPARHWDAPVEFSLMNSSLKATPRKIVVHTLLHEIRHWAQIGTLLRLNGLKVEFRDILFSPVMGGEFKRQAS
ncbi:MAG TPA: DinB family protein [Candidatus Angelobacter sp.]